MGELRQLNEQNKLAVWAERVTECRNSGQSVLAWCKEHGMSDIPEEYRDIAEAIGMEAFTQLTLLCGGQSLYIPKRESLERNARDRDIRARFDGGNYRALAVQYRLSERQIRKIINGTRS